MQVLFKKQFLLIIIVCVAAFLRLFQLSQFPVGLHGDEASIGYNAYSLLKTTRDQSGKFLPISINQFGDFRPAGYHYLDIPFIATLGMSTLAIRLPAALIGSLAVLVFYLLVYELFENEFVALLSSGLLAILPWDINIARASSEAVIASFLVILGMYLCLKGVKQKTFSYPLFIGSTLSVILSFFFYHAPRYIVPMLFLVFFLILYVVFHPVKQKIIALVSIYVILLLAIVFFLTTGKGSGRFSEVSLLNIPGGTTQLKTAMDEEGTLNPILTRFYDNKFYYYGRLFLSFYSEHISLDYLFVNNGSPVRYLIPFTGNLYIIEAPFLFFGFAVLVYEGIKKKKYIYLLPLAWFFIAPIPAAFTWEDLPNVERSSFLIFALMMITAVGFYQALLLFKKKMRLAIIVISCLILLQNFLYFYHNYFWRLKIQEPWNRSASEPNLLSALNSLSPNYSQIMMTTDHNNNLIFNLFYNKFDPKKFQEMGSPVEINNLHFGKYVYLYSQCPLIGDQYHYDIVKDYSILYVDRETCQLPKNARILNIIKAPDGAPQFLLVDLTPVILTP